MSFLRQLGALLRKDIVIRKFKRHYIKAVLELAFPVIIWAILIYIWSKVGIAFSIDGNKVDAQVYQPLGPYGAPDIRPQFGKAIYYVPDSQYAGSITNNIFRDRGWSIKGFAGEAELSDALREANDSTVLALQFPLEERKQDLSYTMRWPRLVNMWTQTVFPEGSRPRIAEPSGSFDYAETACLWPLMYAVFEEHLKYFNLSIEAMPTLQPLPTPAYKGLMGEGMFGYLATMISGFIFGTFIIFLSSYSKNIMEDKETRLRELLRMMGLTDSVYWTNAFLVGLLNALPLCLMVTAALCLNFSDVPILKADVSLIFIVVLCYAIGIIFLALLISVLVNSAKLGSVLVLLAQTAGFIIAIVLDPPSSQNYMYLSAFVKLATSMYSPCGIYWAFKLIVSWEKREMAATWSNLFDAAIEEDNITLGAVLLMMIFSWLLWFVVILYVDAIVPWQYGMPKHPLFFTRYSYWFPDNAENDSMELAHIEDGSPVDEDMVEKSNNSNVVIRLNGITHNFGALRAVDNLSLDLYANQITVLLGHNGAGKTTAMNILTGLFPPSQGDIFINGHDVRRNTKKAREGVGLCPQHNVLFEDLTVEEHLQFFAMLKSSTAGAFEVRDLLSRLGLIGKASTLSRSLSGGMKRKLSLANAMVGGSSILILDEPSSGLDPEARRVVWDLLQQERTRRTVLMTTHYMEEADVLGDRIAFLAKGKLMCAGSPMFLKRKFETGYKLRITKVDQWLDAKPIVDLIKTMLPQNAEKVELVSNMSYEMLINIGFPGSVQMINLFKHLENNQHQLGIESLGTSVTTMEDVFLKVGQREEDLVSKDKKEQTSVNVFDSFPKFERLSGPSLILRQMVALIVMRFHSLRRDRKIIVYMTLLPLAFSFFLAIILTPGTGISRSRAITYDINNLLRGPQGFIAGGKQDPVAEAFKTRLEENKVRIDQLPRLETKDQLDEYFLAAAKENPTFYKFHAYAGILKDSNSIYFNGQPFHVGAAALADWQAARLTELTKTKPSDRSTVTITNHPLDALPSTPPIVDKVNSMRFLTVLFMSLVFSYVSCALIIIPIQERIRKSKLIQIMSGVRPEVYIGSNFIFDGILMWIALLLCLIMLLCFNAMSGFTSLGETIPAVLLVFLLYIFASTPWAYILSYLFTSSTTGFSVYLAVNVVTVFIAGLIFTNIELFLHLIEDEADKYLHVLNFVPVFAASWSFTTAYRRGCAKSLFNQVGAQKACSSYASVGASIITQFCENGPDGWSFKDQSVFNMHLFFGIGFQLIALTVMGLIGSVLLMFIEMNARRFAHVADSISIKKLLSCCKPQEQDVREIAEDSAVQAERQAVYDIVANDKIQSHSLVAKDVTKYYGSFKAVNNISFHVEKNECFGLLGVNGAGKTTTFSMLTGDCMMTDGNSYIQQTDVNSKLQAYQEYIGYCPQFDALADTLTGREILSLFCGLRGVPSDQVETMIDFMTTMADLKPHIDKLTQTYSGGNKRKLSLAIAMIGNPPLLFLDEPSAGVDPGARRRIWATLSQAQEELNSSVVLTSHSMDECEALCNRLVIMIRGTFRCLGSSQQIKTRYGRGFTVLIKTKATEHDQKDAVENVMRYLFKGRFELKDSYQCLLQFHVNDTELRWSEVFERIENLRENPQLQLEDVQVSDTTLEQVFLNFAKENAPNVSVNTGTTTHAFAA